MEVVTIGRLVNAFFRWEFNSCETLVKDGEVYPIDYANACPDVALTSPALLLPLGDQGAGEVVRVLRWSPAAGRGSTWTPSSTSRSPTTRALSYAEKLDAYRALADGYFESERYQDFCATGWPAWTRSFSTGWRAPDFDDAAGRHRPVGRTRPTSTISSSRTCAA